MADASRPKASFSISGEIDIDNALALGDELSAEMTRVGSGDFVVDCSAVTFVGSRGLAMMARVQRHAEELGVSLVWLRPNERILHLIGLAGLDPYLQIQV